MTTALPRTAVRMIEPELVAEALAALRTPAGQSDPYPHYRRLRSAGTAGVAPDGALIVVGYAACAAVLREHRLVKTPERLLVAAGFADWRRHPSLRMLYGSMLMANPPEHGRLRGAVSAAFTPRRVAGLRAVIETVADELVAASAGEIDFIDTVAFPFPVAVIGALLGVPADDRARFQQLVRDWTMVLEYLAPVAVERADAAAAEIARYLGALAAERRVRPCDDLVSDLVAGSALTDEELVTTLALLLGAGFETTTGLLGNGLLALLRRPRRLAELRARPGLAAAAAEELLRYDTPVQMLFGRSAASDVTVAGLPLAAGQRLVTVVGAANRDPGVFAEPDELRFDRTGAAALSFGGGVHYCLGAPLARLETEILLRKLVGAYPRAELAGEPVHRAGLTLHGYVRLPVRLR